MATYKLSSSGIDLIQRWLDTHAYSYQFIDAWVLEAEEIAMDSQLLEPVILELSKFQTKHKVTKTLYLPKCFFKKVTP